MATATKEVIMPGDGDYVDLGIKEAELYANPNDLQGEESAPASSTDGWEDRARQVEYGRFYEFEDLSKVNRLLGDVATTGFDRRRPISDYGMPREQTRNRIMARTVFRRGW